MISRFLLPRWEEGRVEGVAAELGRLAQVGSEPHALIRRRYGHTPIPDPSPLEGEGRCANSLPFIRRIRSMNSSFFNHLPISTTLFSAAPAGRLCL